MFYRTTVSTLFFFFFSACSRQAEARGRPRGGTVTDTIGSVESSDNLQDAMVDIFTPNTSPRAENDKCQVALCGAPGTTSVGTWAWSALRDGTLDKMIALGALDDLMEQGEPLGPRRDGAQALWAPFGTSRNVQAAQARRVPGKVGCFFGGPDGRRARRAIPAFGSRKHGLQRPRRPFFI